MLMASSHVRPAIKALPRVESRLGNELHRPGAYDALVADSGSSDQCPDQALAAPALAALNDES
jgi:hypothetical protein